MKAVPGSRPPVDVVPCFRLHYVFWNTNAQQYGTVQGIAILDRDLNWTSSYPDQHHARGIDKRARTQLRFKKIVRMLKRLRDELIQTSALGPKEVPSFLIESLVHGVEDQYFLVEQDDRYDRLLRIVRRMGAQVHDQACYNAALEINGINSLFGADPTRLASAQKFTNLALQSTYG